MPVPPPVSEQAPPLTLHLARQGLQARDLRSAVAPALNALVQSTAARGAAYFQLNRATGTYHAHATHGDLGHGPHIEQVRQHGLPHDLPLLHALKTRADMLFFDDTAQHPDAGQLAALNLRTLSAAPVLDSSGQLVGALIAHAFTPHAWTPEERALMGQITSILTLLTARLDAEARAQDAHESLLQALGRCLEARDSETQGHTDRVTHLAVTVAQHLGLDGTDLRDLRWGAYLHDIGKLAIPDSVLHHPGALNAQMRAVMQTHVEHGLKLAAQLPFLPQASLDVIALHHERWDGSGYPHGRRDLDIPLHVRIFTVCDVYDALVSARPYKTAWTPAQALQHLRAHSGTHFDPQVVTALQAVLPQTTGRERAASAAAH